MAADKDFLEQVQQRAVRMVSELKGASYEEQLKALVERCHQADMQMVHRRMHRKSDLEPKKWFEMRGGTVHATRCTVVETSLASKSGREGY
jgi:hypothetical protein